MIALLLAAEVVLAKGGELDGPPAQTVVRSAEAVHAFGFSEVPPQSRLQAALALADANARAELVKLVRARITDQYAEHATEKSEEIERRTKEIASGLLPALAPPQHGWRRIDRDGEQVLQVWARVSIKETALHEMVRK